MRKRRGTLIDGDGTSDQPIEVETLNKKWAAEHPSPDQQVTTPSRRSLPTPDDVFAILSTPVTRSSSKKLFDAAINDVTPVKATRGQVSTVLLPVRQSPRHRQPTPILKRRKGEERPVEEVTRSRRQSIDVSNSSKVTRTAQAKRNDLVARRVSFDPSVDYFGRDAGNRKGSKGVSSGVKGVRLGVEGVRLGVEGVRLGVKGTSKAEDEKNNRSSKTQSALQSTLITTLLVIGYFFIRIDSQSTLRELDGLIDTSASFGTNAIDLVKRIPSKIFTSSTIEKLINFDFKSIVN